MIAALGCAWVTVTHLRPRWIARRAARRADSDAASSDAAAKTAAAVAAD